MNDQCRYIVDKARTAASREPDSTLANPGGLVRWSIGSAVDQNKMPIAMVVQIVIENQFQRLINGFALGPPIRTLANPDLQNTVQQIARQSMTEKKAQTLKSHPN